VLGAGLPSTVAAAHSNDIWEGVEQRHRFPSSLATYSQPTAATAESC
jgi:hypothetical protein